MDRYTVTYRGRVIDRTRTARRLAWVVAAVDFDAERYGRALLDLTPELPPETLARLTSRQASAGDRVWDWHETQVDATREAENLAELLPYFRLLVLPVDRKEMTS